MSGDLDALATRLRRLAKRLREPDLGDEQAAALAREAADLVSEAGNAVDRAIREADSPEG